MGKTSRQGEIVRSGRTGAPVVFISSTVDDLRLYRDAVAQAAREAGFLARMCEDWAARGDRPPLDVCLQEVDGADLVIALVAHRYGWVPAGQGNGERKSITWLECERARKKSPQIEVLAFMVDEKHPWSLEFREEHRAAKAIADGEEVGAEFFQSIQQNVAELKRFKGWLGGLGIRAKFSTPESLRSEALKALYEWQKKHPEAFPAGAPQKNGAKGGQKCGPVDPASYLRDLLERTRHIDIRGLETGSGKAHRFEIEQLYISLTTVNPVREGLLRGEEKIREGSPHGSVPLHEALSVRKLAILGDPGSGKTTFLRRVASTLCQDLLGPVSGTAKERLGLAGNLFPVFVRFGELGDFIEKEIKNGGAGVPATRDAADWLPLFLARSCEGNHLGLDKRFFDEKLQAGEAIVLLDGLDEAPSSTARKRLAQLVESCVRSFGGCRFVATCRPPAYEGEAVLPGFDVTRIDPLGDEVVETFLSRWCEALYAGSPSEKEIHRADLLKAVRVAGIRRLAQNPVMLTALAVIHWNEKRLPEERADLYESIIKWLSRAREDRSGRAKPDVCVALLAKLALAMQDHQKGRRTQVPKRWAAEQIAGEWRGLGRNEAVATAERFNTAERYDTAERFLDEEEVDSGIIVGRGDDVAFWHLTFQEFLAAKAIAARSEAEQEKVLSEPAEKIYGPEWREVVTLLGGVLHRQGREKVDRFFATVLDQLGKKPLLADKARCVGLLGAVLRDLTVRKYEPEDAPYQEARYQAVRTDVFKVFDRKHAASIPVKVRIEAAEALGADDPRLDPKYADRSVEIRGGKFFMGSQKEDRTKPNYDPETTQYDGPVREAHVESFRIARWPVLVGEFKRFVEEEGYREENLWQAGGFEKFKAPEDWDGQLLFPNRPVVGLSWFEAKAYAAWVGARLPTKEEWERAARGMEGRRYPWGNEACDPDRLNFGGNVGRPTPPGIYPLGDTPEGVHDMAGNVWEWCYSLYDRKGRVLRGGSCADGSRNARAAIRGGNYPGFRSGNIGFRLVW